MVVDAPVAVKHRQGLARAREELRAARDRVEAKLPGREVDLAHGRELRWRVRAIGERAAGGQLAGVAYELRCLADEVDVWCLPA
jgi:hypothetical protein